MNRNSFAEIPANGFGKSINNYSAADYAPYEGNNYYRLREIDKDGQFLYSIIAETYNLVGLLNQVKIIPNPVKDAAVIEFETQKLELKNIIITDVTSKTLPAYKVATIKGMNKFAITDIEKMPAGLYFVIMRNSGGAITGSSKFIKQ